MSEMDKKTKNSLVEQYFIIDPSRFHFLKFVLEGYDNLAVLSSHKSKEGIVRIKVAEESRHDLMLLMSEISILLKKKIY